MASAATAAPMGIRPSTLFVRRNSSSDFSAVTIDTATGIEMATADSIALTKKLVSSEARQGAGMRRPGAAATLLRDPLEAGLKAAAALLRASTEVCIE